MQTVTTLQIRDAFKTQILAMDPPTFEPLRGVEWAYTPSPRKNGRADLPAATRNFDIIFGAGAPNYAWTGGIGTAYQARVAIATRYMGMAGDLIEHALTADGVDLRRALCQLRDPTLPGLANVIAQGVQNLAIDVQGDMYVEYVFEINYHQSTD